MDHEHLNPDKIKAITEKTLVPVGAVFLIISAVCWFATDKAEVRAAVNNNSEKIAKTEERLSKQGDKIVQLLQDVAVIRETVQRIDRKLSR